MFQPEATVLLTKRPNTIDYSHSNNTLVIAADIVNSKLYGEAPIRIRHAGSSREIQNLSEEETRNIDRVVREVVHKVRKIIVARKRKSPAHIEELKKDERLSPRKRNQIIGEIEREPDAVTLFRELDAQIKNTCFTASATTHLRVREILVDGERFTFW